MRFRKRADVNQTEIANALRECGWVVAYTYQLGEGFPDMVVGKSGMTIMIEAKSSEKSKLTKSEKVFHKEWAGGPLIIVWDPEMAVRECEGILNDNTN